MKKGLLRLVAVACAMVSLSAFAQVKSDAPVNRSYVEHRNEIIKKYGVNSALSMGWYTGGVDALEIRDLWNNYTVLSNYLSERLGRVVVLETDKNDREVSADALKSMDIVYTSAIMGAELMKAGWKPVVGRTEDLQSVVLVNNSAKSDTPADLKNLKIYGVQGATVTYFALNSLIKSGAYKPEEASVSLASSKIKIVNTKQNQLLELLKSKEADGVILRETIANNLMKANPGKYKIAFKADAAPGHIIFVSPSVKEDVIAQLKESFLALTPDNPSYKKILSGLDGYQETDKIPFKVVTPAFTSAVNSVLVNTGGTPLISTKK